KRAEWLLEAMPIEVTAAEIREAVGDALRFPPAAVVGHGLTVIERMRRAVYDERTGVNRAAKEKRATAEQLSSSLPAEEVSADELRQRVDALRSEGEALGQDRHQRLLAIEQHRTAKMAALVEERDVRIREIEEEYAGKIEALNRETEENRQAVIAETDPKMAELREAYARTQERLRSADRDANTRQVVAQMEGEVAKLEERSRALTEALARLDALKLG